MRDFTGQERAIRAVVVVAVNTVDQGIALLTTREARQLDEHGLFSKGSVNQVVAARLAKLAETLKEDEVEPKSD